MNFDNMPRSFVTLFALMVVNNWQVIISIIPFYGQVIVDGHVPTH